MYMAIIKYNAGNIHKSQNVAILLKMEFKKNAIQIENAAEDKMLFLQENVMEKTKLQNKIYKSL